MKEFSSADRPLSSGESLAIIESMVLKAKNQFSENGHLYLLWGWVIFICSMVHYLSIRLFHFPQVQYIWLLVLLAAVYMIIYLVRTSRKKRVKTYTDELLGATWMAFGVSMCIVALIFGKSSLTAWHTLMNPVYLCIYGIPLWVSGVALKFKLLKLGALSCWILSVLAIFVPPAEHLLLIALAMILAWIIPGYLLKKRYSEQQAIN